MTAMPRSNQNATMTFEGRKGFTPSRLAALNRLTLMIAMIARIPASMKYGAIALLVT